MIIMIILFGIKERFIVYMPVECASNLRYIIIISLCSQNILTTTLSSIWKKFLG